MTVGERIKKLRTKLGMSQVDFADKINVSKQTLYKYENNIITNIPSDKVEEAARIGNVSPAYLMGWEDPIALFAGTDAVRRKIGETYKLTMNIDESKELLGIYGKLSSANQTRVIQYSKNLLATQEMEEELIASAAHERTDIEVTDDMKKQDDDFMQDDKLWK